MTRHKVGALMFFSEMDTAGNVQTYKCRQKKGMQYKAIHGLFVLSS